MASEVCQAIMRVKLLLWCYCPYIKRYSRVWLSLCSPPCEDTAKKWISTTKMWTVIRHWFCLHTDLQSVSSVTQLCLTFCDPMNHSTPGLPVHHQLPEFTQTHVIRVGDAQPSHPLPSPSHPALNPSQHQGLFQ